MNVGVVGPEPATDDVAAAVDRRGGTAVLGTPGEVVGGAHDAVVAVGEAALLALVREGVAVPVLPVDCGRGVESVSAAATDAALDRLFAGEWTPNVHPVVAASATGADLRARALMDVALVTADPGRISEYAVGRDGETIARFRADGVVVATPAGSPGYARSAGGPVVAPGADVVSVVPIAPFATDADEWVVPVEEVTLTVARDEEPVDLLADDRTVGRASVGDPVRLDRTGTVELVRVPESRPFHAAPGDERADGT